jgi:hypothetical protein
MKIDQARLAIEPRSVDACIDLATLFYRTHAIRILGLTLVFGGPVTLVAYWLTAETDTGWLWSGALFFFLSPFLGAALVAGAGHWVFGDPFTITGALKVFFKPIWSLLYTLVLTRVAIAITLFLCWGLPSIPLATRYGYLPEVILLEQLGGSRIGKRHGELVRHAFWDAMIRYTAIACFAAAASLSVFTLIDIGSGILLGFPILIGRASSVFYIEEISNLLLYDPLVVATVSATLWLVYPLARLAWFFCYLDARIRKEGWDVELAFRIEARRLQSAA